MSDLQKLNRQCLADYAKAEASLTKCAEFLKLMVLVLDECTEQIDYMFSVFGEDNLHIAKNRRKIQFLSQVCLHSLAKELHHMNVIAEKKRSLGLVMAIIEDKQKNHAMNTDSPIPSALSQMASQMTQERFDAFHGLDNTKFAYNAVPFDSIRMWNGDGWPTPLAFWFVKTFRSAESHKSTQSLDTCWVLEMLQSEMAAYVKLYVEPKESGVKGSEPKSVFLSKLDECEDEEEFMQNIVVKVQMWAQFNDAIHSLMLYCSGICLRRIAQTLNVEQLHNLVDKNEKLVLLANRQNKQITSSRECRRTILMHMRQADDDFDGKIDDLEQSELIKDILLDNVTAPDYLDEWVREAGQYVQEWDGGEWPKQFVQCLELVRGGNKGDINLPLTCWRDDLTGRIPLRLDHGPVQTEMDRLLSDFEECNKSLNSVIAECSEHYLYVSQVNVHIRSMIAAWDLKRPRQASEPKESVDVLQWPYIALFKKMMDRDNSTKRQLERLKSRAKTVLDYATTHYTTFYLTMASHQTKTVRYDSEYSRSLYFNNIPRPFIPGRMMAGMTRAEMCDYLKWVFPRAELPATKKAIEAVKLPVKGGFGEVHTKSLKELAEVLRSEDQVLHTIMECIRDFKIDESARDEIPVEALQNVDIPENRQIVINYFMNEVRPLLQKERAARADVIFEWTAVAEIITSNHNIFYEHSLGVQEHNIGEYFRHIDEGVAKMKKQGTFIEQSVVFSLVLDLGGSCIKWKSNFNSPFSFVQTVNTIELYKRWIQRTGETEFYRALEECKRAERESRNGLRPGKKAMTS